jgi:hypothetical protein
VCDSLGLNPLTQPFDYIRLSGKLVLYAKRDAAEQLRKLHGISITDVQAANVGDVYVVTVKAQDATGRTDASTGAVPIGTLKGEALANALMKAETKAKRRVTLSICGLGMLDETEVESIAPRPPVVVEAPATPSLTNELPAGAEVIERLETQSTEHGLFAKVILRGGRELVANGAQMIAALEQWCQDGLPLELVTKRVKKRGSNPPEFYEKLEEARALVPPKPSLAPDVSEADAVL